MNGGRKTGHETFYFGGGFGDHGVPCLRVRRSPDFQNRIHDTPAGGNENPASRPRAGAALQHRPLKIAGQFGAPPDRAKGFARIPENLADSRDGGPRAGQA